MLVVYYKYIIILVNYLVFDFDIISVYLNYLIVDMNQGSYQITDYYKKLISFKLFDNNDISSGNIPNN